MVERNHSRLVEKDNTPSEYFNQKYSQSFVDDFRDHHQEIETLVFSLEKGKYSN